MEWTDRFGQTWAVTVKRADVNGRPEIVGVTITSDPPTRLTKETLKAFPLSHCNERPPHRPVAVPNFPSRRGVPLGPEGLSAVAAVYTQAWSEGRPVQRAVADAFGIALGTARNRIVHARREGYLRPVVGPMPRPT